MSGPSNTVSDQEPNPSVSPSITFTLTEDDSAASTNWQSVEISSVPMSSLYPATEMDRDQPPDHAEDITMRDYMGMLRPTIAPSEDQARYGLFKASEIEAVLRYVPLGCRASVQLDSTHFGFVQPYDTEPWDQPNVWIAADTWKYLIQLSMTVKRPEQYSASLAGAFREFEREVLQESPRKSRSRTGSMIKQVRRSLSRTGER